MNKLKELSKKKWFIVLVIVLAIALVGGLGTYAMFYWRSAENTEITLKIGDIADVTFPEGQELNTNSLAPVFNYTDGETLTFSIENKDTTGATIKYTVNFNITNIDEQLRSTQLKYKLVSGNTILGEGDFSTATSNSTMKLAEGSLPTGTSNYTLYLYIDSNEENNPNMMNRNITGVVEVTAADEGAILANYIKNLYLNNKDNGTVTNNNIQYQYASSQNLMNDRLGGTTADLDGGNVRYYGNNPNNYIDIGDVGFEGMREVGNWEKFGAQLESSQQCEELIGQDLDMYTNYCREHFDEVKEQFNVNSIDECEPAMENFYFSQFGIETLDELCGSETKYVKEINLWRIIGVFDGKVRIIRDDVIDGYYSWDTSLSDVNDGYGINQWGASGNYDGADLMKLLNPGYETNTDFDSDGTTEITVNNSLWWNKQSGTCYNGSNNQTTTCDFTKSGLADQTKTFIDDQTVYLGAIEYNSSNFAAELYSDQAYKKERGDVTFSVDNNSCQQFGRICNDNVERTLSWTGKVALPYPSDFGYAADLNNCQLKLNNYYNCENYNWMKTKTWTISPGNLFPSCISYISSDLSSNEANSSNSVRPVLTLKASVERLSGTGTKEDPYRIK